MSATAQMPPILFSRCNRQLWFAGGALALFFGVIVAGNFVISPQRAVGRGMLGHDFLSFYAAGHFACTGRSDRLYDQRAIHEFQAGIITQNHIEGGDLQMPFWNPPFVAWLFAPLSLLPYPAALNVWWAIMLTCLIASIWLMARMLPENAGWRAWGLIPLLMATSLPFQQAATHGQNTFLSLLLLCLTVTFWRKGMALAAGAVAGLLMYKPQLGLVVAAVLMLSQGRRALLGFLFTTTILGVLTVVTMPGATGEFLFQMPRSMRLIQEQGVYLWERHITLKAFWRLVIQGHAAGAMSRTATVMWGLSELALICVLASALFRHIRFGRWRASYLGASVSRSLRVYETDRLISATILCMPLLMPYFFDYDLLVLAIPAVLLGAELAHSADVVADRWLLRAWVGLCLWMLAGPSAARWLHVNLATPLLALVAVMHIARTFRRSTRPVEIRIEAAGPMTAAA